MKNQYFGDVNDYRKYGLLRCLRTEIGGHLMVAWMLTPDDGSSDGSLRSYATDPGRWAHHDGELFTELARLFQQDRIPGVALIEETGLLPDTSYYHEIVPDGGNARERWRQGLLAAARGADLVFLDPDNGVEVPSRPLGRKDSSKYVAWQEVEALWASGCSVLVYQHFPRVKRAEFAQRIGGELARRTGASRTDAFRTPHVLFLLATQERHALAIQRAIDVVRRRWGDQIERLGMSNMWSDSPSAADAWPIASPQKGPRG